MLVFRKKEEDIYQAARCIALLEIPLLERKLTKVKLIAKMASMISFIRTLHILGKTLGTMAHTNTYFPANISISSVQQAMTLISFGFMINAIGTRTYAFLFGKVKR
jgi:hypothetical protein